MNAPLAPATLTPDPHWLVRPEHDGRTYLALARRGQLRPGHTMTLPCRRCAEPVVPPAPRVVPTVRTTPPPPSALPPRPPAERPTVPVRGDRAVPPTLRPVPVAQPRTVAPVTPVTAVDAALGEPLTPLVGPTVREALVMALASLGAGDHDVTELIVAAWKRWPERFGLRGYVALYPDANRVLAKLYGADGLFGMGVAKSRSEGRIEITTFGRQRARLLEASHGGR